MRPLSKVELEQSFGRGPYRSKYFAGTMPWHRSLRDVNLCNGNLFKSFTDIQVAPARGAGLAMQRTYNSQDDRIGPFGQGWTHAYDIRTVEENPATNYTDDSLNYMDRSDFFGGQHKYHRDADGLYSPPAYLFDETDSTYDTFLVNGPVKSLEDSEHGMDGTVKHFVTNSGSPEGVCDYIDDRYGNRTSLACSRSNLGAQSSLLWRSQRRQRPLSSRPCALHWSPCGLAFAMDFSRSHRSTTRPTAISTMGCPSSRFCRPSASCCRHSCCYGSRYGLSFGGRVLPTGGRRDLAFPSAQITRSVSAKSG